MGDASEYRHLADAGLGGVSAVVASLPAGYTLGEKRVVDGVKYKLVYNAGNTQVLPGQAVTPVGSAGPYSVTITMATSSNKHFGAGVVQHATITTGTYGWVALSGRLPKGLYTSNTSIPTGSFVQLDTDGVFRLAPDSIVTGNAIVGVNVGGAASKTITTASPSGDVLLFMPDV